ncbi:hypothetical protein [Streptomyces albofaciens]|uniref:hypothetical protein n=1 Tax=Streptomyces albofaciens TaxID=66866 RepID=UPI001239E5E2|nr:hypothetical protein [Streptomyces albofaciens]
MSETGTASGQQGAPSADAGGTPPAAPPNSPPTAPADNAPTAPAADPAAEQRVSAAEQAAQQAATERDDLLAALRKVLDPEGADGEADPARLAEQAAAERDQAAPRRGSSVSSWPRTRPRTPPAPTRPPARLPHRRAAARRPRPDDKAFGDKLAEVIKTAVEAARTCAPPLPVRPRAAPTSPAPRPSVGPPPCMTPSPPASAAEPLETPAHGYHPRRRQAEHAGRHRPHGD